MDMPAPVTFGKRLVTQISEDNVTELAAALAYRFLFALFPFAIFVAALSAFVAPLLGFRDPTGQLLGSLSDNLPPDVANQIRPQLETVLGQARPGLLSVGAVAALWAARGGIASVIKSMNTAYDVEETRSFLAQQALAIVLTIVGSAGLILSFVALIGGSVVTEQIAAELGIGGTAWTVITLLRFPVVLALVALAVAVLFHFGPNVQASFRYDLLGGIVFATIWTIATVVFGIYVANFASYSNTYGALGGIVILMLWFYITGLALLVAAEITSMVAKDREPEKIEARRQSTHEGKAGQAARKAGQTAGAAAGVASSAVGDATGRREGGRATDRNEGADTRPRGRVRTRDGERTPDATPARPRPAHRPAAMAHPAGTPGPGERRQNRVFALAVTAIGAVAGLVLGRLAGSDDDEGASAA